MKIKVGIIFGGESVEHEVSIISALQAIQNIDEEKYEVVPIYIDKHRNWYTGYELLNIVNYRDMDFLHNNIIPISLCNNNGVFELVKTKGLFRKVVNTIDVAFPIVHGVNVEDGSLAGYLDTLGIPYVESGVLASSLGQDKVVMKQVFESNKLPIVKYVWFYDYEYEEKTEEIIKKIEKLDYPIIVKPATLGSSVGISVVHSKKDLKIAIEDAIKYDKKIIVEKLVENLIEVNASVLGNFEYFKVSEIEEVMSTSEFLTYKDKYIGNAKGSKSKGMASTNRIIPARIDKNLTEEVKELATQVFKVLNFSGVVRIDFLIDKKSKKVYINEPNTIPGSLSFYLWNKSGLDYKNLLDELITIAIKDYKNKKKKIYSFDTNILKNLGGLKGTKGKLK